MKRVRQETFYAGEVIDNRYELISKIGVGGMGEVFLAKDRTLNNTKVAIKFLNLELLSDENKLQRFSQEILSSRKVSSPYVVKTFDAYVNKDFAYYVMEYIEGYSLETALEKGFLNPQSTITILHALILGLKAIHEVGIIHRDLKPGNVLITNEGQIKITDFGIAKNEASNLTQDGEILGSSLYMSPEMWQNEKITPHADIYSLGVLIYQMLTGIMPFDGETMAQIMYQHLKGQIAAPHNINDDIPLWLSMLTELMLEVDTNKRPQLSTIEEALIAHENDEKVILKQELKNEKKVVSQYDKLLLEGDAVKLEWDSGPEKQTLIVEDVTIKIGAPLIDLTEEKESPYWSTVVHHATRNVFYFSFRRFVTGLILSMTAAYFLIAYGHTYLTEVITGINVGSVDLNNQITIFAIKGIFYTLLVSLPIFPILLSTDRLAQAIFSTFKFSLCSFIFCVLYSCLELFNRFDYKQILFDFTASENLAHLNTIVPETIKTLIEACFLLPFNQQTLAESNSYLPFGNLPIETIAYYSALFVTVGLILEVLRGSAALAKCSNLISNRLTLILISTFLTQIFIYSVVKTVDFFQVEHRISLGMFHFELSTFSLLCAATNWIIVASFLTVMLTRLSKNKKTKLY